MIPEIDQQSFATAHADGAFVLDVREPYEYVAGHVPGARMLPMAHVHAGMSELPTGERIYVICASGNRSRTAASWLAGAGIDAVSVTGGTAAWSAQGRRVVRGRHADDPAA